MVPTGGRRSGKTSILRELERILREERHHGPRSSNRAEGLRFAKEGPADGYYHLGAIRGHMLHVRATLQIAKEILRCLSLPEAMIEFVGDRPGHDFGYCLNCDKIQRLGWKPQVGLEEGPQKTIDWSRLNTWWWSQLVE